MSMQGSALRDPRPAEPLPGDERSSRASYAGVIASLAAVLLAIAFYWRWFLDHPLAGVQDWHAYDHTAYFFPRFAYATYELLAGRLALWNPYEIGGVPLLASGQSAVFYPPKIALFALLPPGRAMHTLLVGHYVLTMAGFLAYARVALRTSWPAAVAGALLWGLDPILVRSNWHAFRLCCLAWVPLALLSVEYLIRDTEEHGRAELALLICLTLMLLVGYPDYPAATIGLIAVRVLALAGQLPARCLARISLRLGRAVALALLIAAPQLAPLGANILASARGEHMAQTAHLIVDFVVSGVADLTSAPYVALALAGVLLGRLPARRYPIFGLAACVLFIAAYPSIRELPLMGLTRGTSFVLAQMAFFFLAALGALAVDGIHAGLSARAALPAAKTSDPLRASRLRARARAVRVVLGLAIAASLPTLVAHPFGALGVLGGLLIAARRLPWRSATLGSELWPVGVGLALLAAALIRDAPQTDERFTPAIEPRIQALEAIRPVLAAQPGGLRFFAPGRTRFGDQLWARLPSAATHEESLLPARQQRLLDHFGFWAVELWGRPPRFAAWLASRGWLDELGLAAAEVHPADAPVLLGAGFTPIDRAGAASGGVWLANPQALPRARIVANPTWVANADEALARVTAAGFDPRRSVVLDPGDGAAIAPRLPSASDQTSGTTARGRAEITLDLPEAVTVKVDAPQAGVLVLADSYAAAWRARVNGLPAEVYAADLAYRGVLVPAGSSLVEFRYAPPALRLGVLLCLVGLASTAALALRLRSREN